MAAILGDRWEGDVSISGNSVRIVTDASHGWAPRGLRHHRCAKALRRSGRDRLEST